MKRPSDILRSARRHVRRRPRGSREDVAQVAGLATVVAGIWQIYEPAALIAGGLGLVLWAQGSGGGGGEP